MVRKKCKRHLIVFSKIFGNMINNNRVMTICQSQGGYKFEDCKIKENIL